MTNILSEAKALVSSDRRDVYGSPSLNHTATANIFNAYLSRRYGEQIVRQSASATGLVDMRLDAQDVCVFNICQKLSRLANTPGHRDTLIDIAGYAANIAEL